MITTQTKQPANDHFRAAQRMSEHLPHIHTRQTKRAQQAAILRELVAGLKIWSK